MSKFCENCLTMLNDASDLCESCCDTVKGKDFFELNPTQQMNALKPFKSDMASYVKGALITCVPALLAVALYEFILKNFLPSLDNGYFINGESVLIFLIVGLVFSVKVNKKNEVACEKQEEWEKAKGYSNGGGVFIYGTFLTAVVWSIGPCREIIRMLFG